MPNNSKEQKYFNKKLNKELAHYTFSSSTEVLKRALPKTFGQKFNEWWNKEVTVSLVPVGVATFLLVSASLASTLFQENMEETKDLAPREIIQIGGNFYWSDLFEQVKSK